MFVSVALWGSLMAVPAPPEERCPATLELQWNAPQGCSSAEAIEARIAALLSGPPQGDGKARVVADVRRVSGGVHMTLTTTFEGAADVREVDSARCEALADATAVLLAVSLEPGLEPESEPEPLPEPPAPPPTVPQPVAAEPLEPPPLAPTSQPARSAEVEPRPPSEPEAERRECEAPAAAACGPYAWEVPG